MSRQKADRVLKKRDTPTINLRRWSRIIHRDLSFFMGGTLLIYSLSGIYMNHRDDINPHYTVERITFKNNEYALQNQLDEAEVRALLIPFDLQQQYTQHYYPKEQWLKVFIKGGSTLEFDQTTGQGVLELLKKRPIVSDMVKLHYNPNKWWTYFSDLFCVAMLLILITGFTMMTKEKGIIGRGGLLFLVGVLLPVLVLYLF